MPPSRPRRRAAGALAALLACASIRAEPWDTFSDTWVATDDLGRPLPTHEQTGPPKPDKTVGLFYYLWHGPHDYDNGGLAPDQGVKPIVPGKIYKSPFDISEILKQPEADRPWGPPHRWHHWGQPLFNYYVSNDEWVIRKHAQMLADAGVDVLFFDNTNGLHYRGVYMEICRIFGDIRQHGGRTPAISFNCGTVPEANRKTVKALHEDLYSKGLYRDLWFCWQDKPLLLANFAEIDASYRDFFTLRYSWAWSNAEWFGDGKNRWPWLDHTPQQPGWHLSPGQPEQIAVATAQHPHTHKGKSFHNGKPLDPPRPAEGLFFAEQWKRALEVDPPVIHITQWNEWTAQRFINGKDFKFKTYAGRPAKEGDSVFIDVYDMEHNRDIEPMAGGYGDNYYYQMIDGIRRFKGTRPAPPAGPAKTIAAFADWEAVTPEFRDDRGDTFPRHHFGWGRTGPLTDTTGRNDIVTAKISRDAQFLYFLATTKDSLTPPAGENWMELFLALDGQPAASPSWEGYHFRLHPDPSHPDRYLVQRSTGGWNWKLLGTAGAATDANKLMLTVHRKLLGLEAAGDHLSLRCKWSDNRQTTRAIDWLQHGDAAPNAKFQYPYRTR